MSSESIVAMNATRRAYELGRLRAASVRALLVVAFVALIALVALGRSAVPWALLSIPVVVFAEWCGTAMMFGARRGVFVGAITVLLPLRLLRPCCDPAAMERAVRAGAACCTDASSCVIVGALIGVLAAFALPRSVHVAPRATVVGFTLGTVSVAATRCAPLFAGEALGLLFGLGGALLAAATARAFADVRRQRATTR